MESMLTCSKDEMHGTIAACSELQDDSILQLSFAICFGSYLLVDVYTGTEGAAHSALSFRRAETVGSFTVESEGCKGLLYERMPTKPMFLYLEE